ncbi:MAG: transcription termination/antitermination factor NusG [Oscillospiraceae bacterium]|nr:transcription termination/antitermination factor NusG [Oscillospiraceae bacterium]
MAEEAKWYVIHTYSGYENAVADSIVKSAENRRMQDRILDVKIPMETVTEMSENGTKTVERKTYPGYVFVKMILTDESWHLVRNVRGVTGFVGPANKAVPLTEEEILSIGVEKHDVVVDFAVGDSVKVTDGPLDGFFGTVEEIDIEKSRVKVVVSMFGRETPVDLDFDQIEIIRN